MTLCLGNRPDTFSSCRLVQSSSLQFAVEPLHFLASSIASSRRAFRQMACLRGPVLPKKCRNHPYLSGVSPESFLPWDRICEAGKTQPSGRSADKKKRQLCASKSDSTQQNQEQENGKRTGRVRATNEKESVSSDRRYRKEKKKSNSVASKRFPGSRHHFCTGVSDPVSTCPRRRFVRHVSFLRNATTETATR